MVLCVTSLLICFVAVRSAPFNLIGPYSLHSLGSFCCLHMVHCERGLFLLLLSFIVFAVYLIVVVIKLLLLL